MERDSRGKQIEALCDVYRNVYDFLALRGTNFAVNIFCENFIDTTGDVKENFLNHYYSISDAKDINRPLQFLPRNRDKSERIAGLEALIGNSWLVFRKSKNHGTDELPKVFMDQMCEFPVADFNDGPGSLSGAWECKIETTTVGQQAHRERTNHRVQESRVIQW